MEFALRSAGSKAGGQSANEDAYGFLSPDRAWVIDGATSTDPNSVIGESTGGKWLAEQLHAYLSGDRSDDLPAEVLTRASRWLYSQWLGLSMSSEVPPYGSLAYVHLIDEQLHYGVLGDVVIATRSAVGAVELIKDDRSEPFQRMALDLSYRTQGLDLSNRQREFEKRYVNTKIGYPIFTVFPHSPEDFLTGIIEVTPGMSVLIASDGFSRLVDTFGTFDIGALIEAIADPDGVPTMLSTLRAIELADPERHRYRRLKVHDDATGLLLVCRSCSVEN
jgi:hypothetical protein